MQNSWRSSCQCVAHTRNQQFAAATDYSYVYGGVQGSAIQWRAQQWVTNKGPVINVDLWIEMLELLDASVASYKWIKVPSHMQLEGNERADALAEPGRKSFPLYSRAGRQPHVLLTPLAAPLPGDPWQSPPVDSASARKFSIEMTPMVSEADLGFAKVTPSARGGGLLPFPIRQPEFESAMDFYTPTGATGALRSLGLQLIDSPASDVSSKDSRSVICAVNFMEEDEFATSMKPSPWGVWTPTCRHDSQTF